MPVKVSPRKIFAYMLRTCAFNFRTDVTLTPAEGVLLTIGKS